MKLKSAFSYSKSVIAVLALIITMLNFSHHQWQKDDGVIVWDIKSYYAYLPATFIYKDLSLQFRQDNIEKFGDLIWPISTPTGKLAIITSMGMSMMYAPFFFIAHTITPFTNYAADGYSLPYKFALVFSAMFYLLLGLFYLRRILLRYFDDWLVAFVMFAVVAGTNLLYYSTYEAAMPHAFNFSLIIIFMYHAIKWHEKQTIYRTIVLGLIFGLITLIRPTNILVLLFFVFWNVHSFGQFTGRIGFFLWRWKHIVIMVAAFFMVWLPQFMYWKYVADKFLYFSYGEAGGTFFFNNPQIYNILFSYRKGWLVYTPIMVFAIVGIAYLRGSMQKFRMGVLVFLILNIYVLASWWCWWYGGSFGLRAFIDSYGIMAIPLAAFIGYSRNSWWRMGKVAIIVLLIAFNNFQIQQYRHQAIHYWWMNKDAYWETFLKLRPTSKYWNVITIPDYDKARQGIYVDMKPEPKPEDKSKLTANDNEIIALIKKELILDTLRLDSLNSIAINRGIEIDSVLTESAKQIFTYSDKETYRRKIIIGKLEQQMRDNPDMIQYLKDKAHDKGISLDSMIVLDAIWLYENNEY